MSILSQPVCHEFFHKRYTNTFFDKIFTEIYRHAPGHMYPCFIVAFDERDLWATYESPDTCFNKYLEHQVPRITFQDIIDNMKSKIPYKIQQYNELITKPHGSINIQYANNEGLVTDEQHRAILEKFILEYTNYYIKIYKIYNNDYEHQIKVLENLILDFTRNQKILEVIKSLREPSTSKGYFNKNYHKVKEGEGRQ
jgi:hypothetical protein